MEIRQAKREELDDILLIYAYARSFMAQTGNPTQWEGGYPSPKLLSEDIAGGHLYVLSEAGILQGVFAFFPEGDPAYDALPDVWQSKHPYAAIHRVASAGKKKGVLSACVDFCLSQKEHLKIDTHKDNLVMQNALSRLGFRACGVANIPDVGERILYELCKEDAQ